MSHWCVFPSIWLYPGLKEPSFTHTEASSLSAVYTQCLGGVVIQNPDLLAFLQRSVLGPGLPWAQLRSLTAAQQFTFSLHLLFFPLLLCDCLSVGTSLPLGLGPPQLQSDALTEPQGPARTRLQFAACWTKTRNWVHHHTSLTFSSPGILRGDSGMVWVPRSLLVAVCLGNGMLIGIGLGKGYGCC